MKAARILVVEDDRVVARDLKQQLTRLGYEVVGITSRGEDASALALATSADLALTDIRLEGAMDGVDAAQDIRLACDIPVVFLTAYADNETIRRARVTEPFGYLLKPFEDSQLRTAVEMALYKHATDRKLRHSERRYAATLSSIGDAVISTDDAGLITYMNPVAESLTACDADAAIGKPLAGVFRVIDEETGLTIANEATPTANSSMLLTAGNGHPAIPIERSASPIIDDRGRSTGTVLVFRNLAHKRSVERRLREAQLELARVSGLNTMGELAASIAHEINQPLAAIVTNASAGLNWLQRPVPELQEVQQVLSWILADGTRAARVIASMQALARRSGLDLIPMDVHETIHEVIALMRTELQRHQVRVQLHFSEPRASVFADKIQIQQVLVNLFRNALEAMEGCGDTDRMLVVQTSATPQNELVIQVIDSGHGIAEEHMDKLFDAFFTTRKQGLGMGLAICRSIVEAHGGRLWAEPNDSRGTRLAFLLQAAPAAA